MKYVVYFAAISVAGIALKSAGISSSETEYWVAYASLQIGGFCLGWTSK